MTSEVTKRGLWFGFNGGGEPDGTYCTMKTGDPNEQFWVPYDTTLALVAEAYEAAAEFAADTADQEQAEDGVVWADLGQVVDAIESRTPADALAAREARDKRIREEALREAEKTARDYGKESYAAKMIGDAILALIEGDTDDQE